MLGKNNILNVILSCIIAFAILFSGISSVNIQTDSEDAYASNQESVAVITAVDIAVARIDMANTEATGIYNNSYIHQIIGQNICIKKSMDIFHQCTYVEDLTRFSYNSFMAKHAIDNSEQFVETVVLNYIHNMDGKKRI